MTNPWPKPQTPPPAQPPRTVPVLPTHLDPKPDTTHLEPKPKSEPKT
jgi:hypothetical protein